MDLDFEDIITQSIIRNKRNNVLVETMQKKDYDLHIDETNSFQIKVKDLAEQAEGFSSDDELPLSHLRKKPRRKKKQLSARHTVLTCEVCEITFDEQADLVDHHRSMHSRHEATRHRPAILRRSQPEEEEEATSPSAKLLQAMLENDPQYKRRRLLERAEEERANRPTIPMNQMRVAVPMNRCDVCGKIYAGEAGLLIHKKTHVLPTPMPTSTPTSMPTPPLWACEVCHDVFLFEVQLRKHTAIKHPTRRPRRAVRSRYARSESLFDCDVCRRSFATQRGLVRHMVVHDAEMHRGDDDVPVRGMPVFQDFTF